MDWRDTALLLFAEWVVDGPLIMPRVLTARFRCCSARDDLDDELRNLSDHCFSCEKRLATTVDSPGERAAVDRLD